MRQVDNCKVNDFQYGEGIYVSNASDNEFVFMKFNCGRIGEEFEAFILTDSISSEYSSYKIHSNIPRFIVIFLLGKKTSRSKLKIHRR